MFSPSSLASEVNQSLDCDIKCSDRTMDVESEFRPSSVSSEVKRPPSSISVHQADVALRMGKLHTPALLVHAFKYLHTFPH